MSYMRHLEELLYAFGDNPSSTLEKMILDEVCYLILNSQVDSKISEEAKQRLEYSK